MRRFLLPAIAILVTILGTLWIEAPRTATAPEDVPPQENPAPSSPVLLPPPSEPEAAFAPPIAEMEERVTKKPFGVFITPETSPVQPERFRGYHTGIDVEYGDVADDVPVSAIADGTVLTNRTASGYGGVVVIRHAIGNETLLALYGHLDPQTLPPQGKVVARGESIGLLGERGTSETDGERKHLHFAILKDGAVDLRGYVQNQEELTRWENPLTFF